VEIKKNSMKKIAIYLSIIGCSFFTACGVDSTDEISDVTNFAVFSLEGEDEILLSKGETYDEPGATATESGSPLPVTINSSGIFTGGSLNTNVPDIYNIAYSATNKDGFEASASRTVVVAENGDLITSISGLYKSTVVRNGAVSADYEDMEYVIIWENTDGTFELSDGIGGYYHYGRGYGAGYAAPGAIITVNGLNDYIFGPDFTVGTFGGVATMTEMTVDPVAKTIDFSTDWDAGPYTFVVHLEQVSL
jgi:hypothetical protein